MCGGLHAAMHPSPHLDHLYIAPRFLLGWELGSLGVAVAALERWIVSDCSAPHPALRAAPRAVLVTVCGLVTAGAQLIGSSLVVAGSCPLFCWVPAVLSACLGSRIMRPAVERARRCVAFACLSRC